MRVKRDNYSLVFIALQFLCAIVVSFLFFGLLKNLTGFFLNLALYLIVFIFPVFIFICKVLKHKPLSYLGLTENSLKGIVSGLLISFFIFMVFLAVNKFSFKFDAGSFWTYFGLVLAGPLEEIPIRGFYLREFSERWGFVRASALSSAMFALLHVREFSLTQLPELVFLFVMGLWLAYLFKSTKSLWAPILVHSFYNLFTALF